jgi:AcrR family transcriptional regulator
MSSGDPRPDTRTRILDAAIDLMRRGVGEASLGQIAKAAGVSRQALYLHFADRADLYLALVRHVDEARDLAGALRRLRETPSGEAELAEAVRMQARMNPGLYPVAAATDALRRQDDAIEAAWRDRLDNRLGGARRIAERLKADGALRKGLDVDTAADVIWTLLSLRMWEDLVVIRGWSAARYEAEVGDLVRRAVLANPDA